MIIEVVRVPADGVITHKERRALITRDTGLADSTGILVLAEFNDQCPDTWIERFIANWNTYERACINNPNRAVTIMGHLREIAR